MLDAGLVREEHRASLEGLLVRVYPLNAWPTKVLVGRVQGGQQGGAYSGMVAEILNQQFYASDSR